MRFVKFNSVGVAGFAVQIAVLAALLHAGVHYLAGTVLAVETAVLQSDVPGEETSKTQPIPSKPAPYSQQGLEEDDLIVTRWVATMTHQGDQLGVPATGRRVTLTGVTIVRLRDGKIVEAWNNYDQLSLLQQIGALQPTVPLVADA